MSKKLFDFLFWILMAAICAVLFIKCSYQKIITQIDKKHPHLIAKIAREKYPCIEKDTITKDSVVYYEKEIEVQVQIPVRDTITGETKIIYEWAKQKVRDSIIYRTQTIKVMDSAFNKIVQSKLDSVIASTNKKLDGEQSKKKSWKVATILLASTTIIAILIAFFRGKLSLFGLINNALKIVNKKINK